MAIPHASPGELIDVRPLGNRCNESITTTLIKTPRLEVIRLVVPAGKEIPPHSVPGEITVQCLEGRIAFTALGHTKELTAGDLLYLSGGAEHSVRGIENASVLVSLQLPARPNTTGAGASQHG